MNSEPSITKAQAISLYGTATALASALRLGGHTAVVMWRDDRPIPERHYLKLRYELRPEAFDSDGNFIRPPEGREARDAA